MTRVSFTTQIGDGQELYVNREVDAFTITIDETVVIWSSHGELTVTRLSGPRTYPGTELMRIPTGSTRA